MTLINSLIQFVSGTKALVSEVNQNFETLRTAHNTNDVRLDTLEQTTIPGVINNNIAAKVSKAGDTMSGGLDMGTHKVTSLTSGTVSGDAINKSQLDAVAVAVYNERVRNTVIKGAVGADGLPNYITPGVNLQVACAATAANLLMTFANGNNSAPINDNYRANIVADFTISNLYANINNYLYVDRDITTGALTVGKAQTVPQWNFVFDKTKYLLLNFDSDATDKYGNTITTLGNPTYTGGKYVGDGTGDGLKVTTLVFNTGDKFCIEGKIKFGTNNTDYILFRSHENYGLKLYRQGSTNKLLLSLSANGSSNNICSALAGTKNDYDTTSEYHIALEFTGTAYSVYVNGVLDITQASTSSVAAITALLLGIDYNESSASLNGTMDDVRATIGDVRYGAAGFAVPASLTADTHWLDLVNYKMWYGSPAAWVQKHRVFLARVLTGASSVQQSDIHPYAYQRKFTTGNITTSAQSTTVNHNLGVQPDLAALYEGSVLKNKDVTVTNELATWTAAAGTSRLILEASF